MEAKLLEDFKKSDCCSCRACMNICIKNAIFFKMDINGFVYPNIDYSKCIGCNLCYKVCHLREKVSLREPIKSFAVINKDLNVLKESTSGGAFSAIATEVIKNDGIVFGAYLDNNLKVSHICVESLADLNKIRGSKYVQSEIGYCFRLAKEFLEKGKFVLFSGTPCQIVGLKAFLGQKEYDNLLTVDVVCHGNPSQAMFEKYISYLENKYRIRIQKFNFRDKTNSWLRYGESFSSNSNHMKLNRFDEFYHSCFVSGNLVQESCFNCKYAQRKRCSDITVCDFWGFQKANIKLNEKYGLSAMMLNTEKALTIFEKFKTQVYFEEVDYDVVVNGNTCLKGPTGKGKYWDYYMECFRNDKIEDAAEQYIKNKKKFIKKQRLLLLLPYRIYKLRRYGIKNNRNRI